MIGRTYASKMSVSAYPCPAVMHDMQEDIDNQFQFVDEIWEDEFLFVQGLKVGGSLRRTTDSDFTVLSRSNVTCCSTEYIVTAC